MRDTTSNNATHELLHPRARDPQPRLLPLLVVGDIRTPLLQVCDQLLDRRRAPDPLQCPSQECDRGIHLPLPQLPQDFLLERAAPLLGAARRTHLLVTSFPKVPPA